MYWGTHICTSGHIYLIYLTVVALAKKCNQAYRIHLRQPGGCISRDLLWRLHQFQVLVINGNSALSEEWMMRTWKFLLDLCCTKWDRQPKPQPAIPHKDNFPSQARQCNVCGKTTHKAHTCSQQKTKFDQKATEVRIHVLQSSQGNHGCRAGMFVQELFDTRADKLDYPHG